MMKIFHLLTYFDSLPIANIGLVQFMLSIGRFFMVLGPTNLSLNLVQMYYKMSNEQSLNSFFSFDISSFFISVHLHLYQQMQLKTCLHNKF